MIGKIYKTKFWMSKKKKQVRIIKAGNTQKEIIEDLEEQVEYLSDTCIRLQMKVHVLEFVLTIAGIILGWHLNKTYHWF